MLRKNSELLGGAEGQGLTLYLTYKSVVRSLTMEIK